MFHRVLIYGVSLKLLHYVLAAGLKLFKLELSMNRNTPNFSALRRVDLKGYLADIFSVNIFSVIRES
jgi:hypothetical protein